MVNFRSLLAAALASLSLISPEISSARAAGADFVRVENGRFKLGNQDFFFVGSNFYRLALADRFSGQDYQEVDSQGRFIYPLVDQVFSGYSKAGIKVVRLWGFSCEGAKGHTATPSLLERQGLRQNPVQLNEVAYQKLDYVLDSAGRHGIKLILPLVNFEHEYCGMEWWVENTIGSADKHLFYTDQRVWEKFTSYVRALLERRNVYNRLAYKDDPSIMAIELANEPHTADYYECTITGLSESECSGRKMKDFGVGTLVHDWLTRISAYVRTIDSNHLLSEGEEGYLASPDSLEASCQGKHTWISNGSKGTDYERNASISGIDFLTAHVYPDNWNIPIKDLPWVKRCVIEHRAAIAKRNGKPIVLEETGFNERPDAYGQKEYKLDRPYFLSKMLKMSAEAGFAGTMVWQAAPLLANASPAEDDDFTFPLQVKNQASFETTPEGYAMLFQVACMRDRAPFGAKAIEGCISICPKGTEVDPQRFGTDAEGYSCFLPQATEEPVGSPYPVCDNGSADASGWGWSRNESLCLGHKESAKQYSVHHGCSCTKEGFQG